MKVNRELYPWLMVLAFMVVSAWLAKGLMDARHRCYIEQEKLADTLSTLRQERAKAGELWEMAWEDGYTQAVVEVYYQVARVSIQQDHGKLVV